MRFLKYTNLCIDNACEKHFDVAKYDIPKYRYNQESTEKLQQNQGNML